MPNNPRKKSLTLLLWSRFLLVSFKTWMGKFLGLTGPLAASLLVSSEPSGGVHWLNSDSQFWMVLMGTMHRT